jgi:hypothetical protein
MTKRIVQFSAVREDLVYKRAESLEEMFYFGEKGEASLDATPGVRMQESFGFDFQSEYCPVICILPISDDVVELVGQPLEDFQVNITILDIGLNTRKLIYQESITCDQDKRMLPIALTEFNDLAFCRGFTIQCYVSRKSDIDKVQSVLWSKSQVVFSKEFTVKASTDEALFEISWVELTDERESANLLMWVEWESTEVSEIPDTQCFTVKANSALKYQFRRLENNSAFGHLSVRILLVQIMNELVSKCLVYCDTNVEPLEGSLHDKLRPIFENLDYSLEDVANQMNSSVELQRLEASSTVMRIVQQMAQVGSTLEGVKFGGFRQ